jgi:predicted neutral ceramidase superfamily lipid hydrolase
VLPHIHPDGGLIATVGGGEFYYDLMTTSADDDIFVFVTAGGKRWKRACR